MSKRNIVIIIVAGILLSLFDYWISERRVDRAINSALSVCSKR